MVAIGNSITKTRNIKFISVIKNIFLLILIIFLSSQNIANSTLRDMLYPKEVY